MGRQARDNEKAVANFRREIRQVTMKLDRRAMIGTPRRLGKLRRARHLGEIDALQHRHVLQNAGYLPSENWKSLLGDPDSRQFRYVADIIE
jgi:hypothetical protein